MTLATLNAINIPSDRFGESISEIQTDILAGKNLIRQTIAIDICKRFYRIICIDRSTSGNGNIAQSLRMTLLLSLSGLACFPWHS